MNWNWSDAWLLMSIISTDKKGTDLRGIISTGDYINHSIFSLDELKTGLEKLVSIDYVKIERERFFTTTRFNREYEKLKAPKSILKAVDQLHELLKTKLIDEGNVKPIGNDVINESIYKSACEEYSKAF